MKQEMRELQRNAELSEMRFLQTKQEMSAKVTEAEMKCDFAEKNVQKSSEDLVRLQAESATRAQEVMQLRAELKAQSEMRDMMMVKLDKAIKV